MRERPYAFLRLGDRWVNMVMVTDVVEEGETLTLYLSADQARMVGGDSPQAVDVARRFTLTDPVDVTRLRKWLKLHDED